MRIPVQALAVLAYAAILLPASLADEPPGSNLPASARVTVRGFAPEAIEPRPRNTFLFPVPPRSPQPSEGLMGTEAPKVDLFLGYSYLRASPGSGFEGFDSHGGSASAAFNLSNWFGMVADFGGYRFTEVLGIPARGNILTYLFGPRFSYRQNDRITPFVQLLFGGARISGSALGTSAEENAFAMAAGGGLDLNVHRNVAIRLVQTEYLLSRFTGLSGSRETQNNVRLSAGIVFRLGVSGPAPPPANRSPVASCSASANSVFAGSGDAVTITVAASDPDGDSVMYDWSATGGSVDGTGNQVRWNSAGLADGTYSVTSRVSDHKGGTTTCSVNIVVAPRPNRAPSMSCAADRSSVLSGERVRITAIASDADGDSLSYSWRTSGGQIVGSGAAVQLDTSGLAADRYTVTGRVDDGRGGAADCATSVNVTLPPPPPQASKLNECTFRSPGGARVDNVCKRILDDVALRLQSDPGGSVVIVGYADPRESRSARLAQQRGQSAMKYVASKGIDASRISVRTASGQVGAGPQNRRIDVIWVPQGATY
ncbi:MAG: hypothetical protein L0387_36600 [Acidobacteria bacterium]|nr:hypothetical protein [Acidobacteriota bacterium]